MNKLVGEFVGSWLTAFFSLMRVAEALGYDGHGDNICRISLNHKISEGPPKMGPTVTRWRWPVVSRQPVSLTLAIVHLGFCRVVFRSVHWYLSQADIANKLKPRGRLR
jgi:hypothetical protein